MQYSMASSEIAELKRLLNVKRVKELWLPMQKYENMNI